MIAALYSQPNAVMLASCDKNITPPIPTTDGLVWEVAADAAGSVGSSVETWVNSGSYGSAGNATSDAGHQPLVVVDNDGIKAVQGNGSSTTMTASVPAAAGAHTSIVVAGYGSFSGWYSSPIAYFSSGQDRGAPHLINVSQQGAAYPHYPTGGNYDDAQYYDHGRHIVALPFAIGAWSAYRDGNVEGSGTCASYQTDITGIELFSQVIAGRYFGGNIYHALLFDRVLPDADRQAWELYLAKKYHIALIAAPDAPTCTASHNAVTLNWDAVSGAGSYNVYRDGTLLATGITEAMRAAGWVDYNVIDGDTHSYSLTAIDGTTEGETAPGAATSITVQYAPYLISAPIIANQSIGGSGTPTFGPAIPGDTLWCDGSNGSTAAVFGGYPAPAIQNIWSGGAQNNESSAFSTVGNNDVNGVIYVMSSASNILGNAPPVNSNQIAIQATYP